MYLDPNNPTIYFNYATIFFESEEFKDNNKALKYYKLFIEKDDGDIKYESARIYCQSKN